jgi:hypothetical protein
LGVRVGVGVAVRVLVVVRVWTSLTVVAGKRSEPPEKNAIGDTCVTG